jgi:hypothetical membrane protein
MKIPLPEARLALAGVAATLVYPLVVVVLQVVQQPGYSPMREAISELALGRSGWLMAVAFCSLALGMALLARLIWTLTGDRIATLLLGLAAAFTVLSAFVHADGEKVHRTTAHGAVHQVVGVLTFVATIVAMFLVARPLSIQPAWRRLGRITRVAAFVGVPAFLLVPVLGNSHFGLAQRALVGVLVAWVAFTQGYAARAYLSRQHHALPSGERAGAGLDQQPAGA